MCKEKFEEKFDYFNKVAAANGFKSVWSMYDDVDSMDEKISFSVKKVSYFEHWGPTSVEIDVDGDTWLDIWRAADKAIQTSGDQHHVFIEQLEACGDTLILHTGS